MLTGLGLTGDLLPLPDRYQNIARYPATADTADTTQALGKGAITFPLEEYPRADGTLRDLVPQQPGPDSLLVVRPRRVPHVTTLWRPREDCRLDAVDPGMVHEPDTTVVASIGVLPPTTRFEPRIRVLRPCPELSEWPSVQPAR